MAGEVRFTIEGAAEMDRLLKELGPRAASRAADRALRAGAKPIVQTAKDLVPTDSGDLQDSITAELQRQRGRSEKRVILVGFKKPISRRAHLTEFGTVHSRAKPFMRPALDREAGTAFGEMGRVLGDEITVEAEQLAGIRGTRRRGRASRG